MQIRQETTQSQTQVQKIGPHLIQANALLQCTNAELLQMIEAEQQSNPALDGVDSGPVSECSLCSLAGVACPPCPFVRGPADNTPGIDAEAAPEDDFRFMMGGSDEAPDELDAFPTHQVVTQTGAAQDQGQYNPDYDPLLAAAAPVSLAEQLVSHLKASADDMADALLMEYLVDCLTEQGYLRIDMDEACVVLGTSIEALEGGIARLQACDPPGIGARNLRECLLLQLEHLRESGDEECYDTVAEVMVRDHWELFTQRRFPRIGRILGVTAERVEEAVAFVQTRLTPYPASQFRQPWIHRPDSASMAIRPDVAIVRTPTGFKVDLPGTENINLQLSPYYRGLYDTIRESRSVGHTAPLPRDLQKHVVEYVERADLFLKNVQRRQGTIQRIAMALVEHQQGFLETGRRAFIRPLTRTMLAHQLGMHESTISRALLHKYVQLPSQEVVPFDIFFGSGSNV
ncbi:MAG: hypothetical protein ACLQVD_20345, partial [Capsulimonadaceae bacterium]